MTRRFYPEIGGVEKHVFEISKELTKRGHKVRVITELSPNIKIINNNNYQSIGQSDTQGIKSEEAVKSIYSYHFEYNKIKTYHLKVGKENWFKKFRIWLELGKNFDLIRDADVIHCHDVFFWYLPFRFLIPRKKVFITFHGHETRFPPTLKSIFIRKIGEWFSWGNICVGSYIKKWYRTKSDYVTYGGVDNKIGKAKVYQDISRFLKKNVVARKKLNILFLGRLEEDNGVKICLSSLALMRKKGIRFEFSACGDGKLRKKVEKYGKVYGFTPVLNKYIDRSDFVFASSYLSILEALIRGKIVISPYQNDLKRDYLRDSPFARFVILGGNPDSLVDKMLSIISSPGVKSKMSLDGYNWAREQTWSKVVDTYLDLWEK